MLTFQNEGRALKYWHLRSGDPQDLRPEAMDGRAVSWALVKGPGSFALLHVVCPLILGVIETCSLEQCAIPVQNWTYVPPDPNDDPAFGDLMMLIDQDVAASIAQSDGRLALKTSFLDFEAAPHPDHAGFHTLPRALKQAVVVLTVSDALRSGETSAWLDLVRSSKLLEELPDRDLPVGVSRSSDTIELRGVLSVSAWPITVFAMGEPAALFEPAALRLSELDEDGEVLFSLIVNERTRVIPEKLYLLATDTIHRLVPR